MAAASFSRLSPSTSRTSRAGAPISRKMATTAAGSVVATIDPSSRQTTSGTPASGHSASPITAVATNTATTASSRMGAASSIIRRTSMVSAAWNSSAGRNTRIYVEELNDRPATASAASRITGGPLICNSVTDVTAMATPTAASRTEWGSFSRSASG